MIELEKRILQLEKENKMIGKAYEDILKYTTMIIDTTEQHGGRYTPSGAEVSKAIRSILSKYGLKLNMEDEIDGKD